MVYLSIYGHASASYKTASATNRSRALRRIGQRWTGQRDVVASKSSIFSVYAFLRCFFSLLNIASRLLVTYSLSLFLSSSLSICHCLSHSLSLCLSLTLSRFISLSLYLSHTTHTHMHIHTAYTAQSLTHFRTPTDIATSKSLCINNVCLLCSKSRG
jgi:hypothetical protein